MRDNLLTIKETATELGIHWQTVRNYIDRGELKAYKIGKLVRISREDLDAFISGSKDIDEKIEVELRYKVESVREIQKKLLDINARQVEQTHIIDHWFVPVNIKSLEEEIDWFDIKRNTGVRIREYINEYGNQISASLETKRLTLAMNHDTFLETEMKVESYHKAKEFMEMLDRKEYLTIDKSRILFKHEDFTISIDSIKDFITGVEIEYIGLGNREEIIKIIENFASKLGLSKKDRFEKSMTTEAMKVLARF